MKFIVRTKSRTSEFFDRNTAEKYFKAVVGVGVDAKLIQEDILGRQTILKEVA